MLESELARKPASQPQVRGPEEALLQVLQGRGKVQALEPELSQQGLAQEWWQLEPQPGLAWALAQALEL